MAESVTLEADRERLAPEEAGVREYWIVDPRPGKERADFWVPDEAGRYQPMPIGDDGTYHAQTLTGFWLRVDWLWAEPPPDLLMAFAEIVGLPPSVVDALREAAARGPHRRDTP